MIGAMSKTVSVDSNVRACINCQWYEQYYRKNRGNIVSWVGTCKGYCLLKGEHRGALRQPCKEFERKD